MPRWPPVRPSKALSLLERYRARHPHGMLLPEALAMRIEAIDRGGEHARARALARAFLTEYPNSPLAQRVAHLGAPDRELRRAARIVRSARRSPARA